MSLPIIKKLDGTSGSKFLVGSVNIKDSTGVAEVRNAGDTDYGVLRAKSIQASNKLNDVATLIDVMDKVIQFSFDGASAPAAGTNTNKFGFCHTTGGSYTANDVVYDDGDSLIKLPRDVVKLIVTTSAVSGTVSLDANGIYGWNGSAYELKGDGGATDAGKILNVKVAWNFEDSTVDSTASIPSGADVIKTVVYVTTALNGTAPKLNIKVNGSTPLTILADDDFNVGVAKQYTSEEEFSVSSDNAGVVRVTVTPSTSDAGEGYVRVFYTTAHS